MELRRRQTALAPSAAQEMIPIRAHQRSRRRSPIFDGSQTGRGCVVLDRPIFFDTARRPDIGELALVVLHDGRLAALPVAKSYERPAPGFVYIEDDEPMKGCSSSRSRVALIGAVTTPAGRVKRLAG